MNSIYENDTFFHLTLFGRIGLVLISLVLSLALLVMFWKISRKLSIPKNVALALLAIYIFIWLTPQIYYLYYIQLIEGLPLQNVIQWPPSIFEVIKTLTFTGMSNLSNHSKGILFWLMMLIALRTDKN